MNRCACGKEVQGSTVSAPLGQEEGLCAATQEPEDQAHDLKKQVPRLYHNYLIVFEEKQGRDALPAHQPWDHKIPIEPGKEVPWGPIYQLNDHKLRTLKEYIDKSLKKGIIWESTSPAGSPVLFVPKKGGKLRLYVDYQKLNSVTIKDRYAIPLIEEMQHTARRAKIFTKFDMCVVYNQV